MPVKNFRFFALRYLDDWYCDDESYVEGLSPANDAEKRLATLWKAAKYYKVTRNLKTLEENRLAGALQALDAARRPSTVADVDSCVTDLADALQAKYGRYAVSAASKFLWLRYKSPIIIYDGQACATLWSMDCKFGEADYPSYRAEWLDQFGKHEASIAEACESLKRVTAYSLAADKPASEVTELVGTRWFRERVFDKFLWWNAGT